MCTQTVGDILDRISDTESRLRRYYAQVREASPDGGARLLSYYLGRRRRCAAHVCGDAHALVLRRVRACEVVVGSVVPDDGAVAMLETQATAIDGNTLLDLAFAYHTEVAEACRRVLERAPTPETARIIGDVLRLQIRELSMLGRMREIEYF